MLRSDQKINSILDQYEKDSAIATEFRRIYSNLRHQASGKDPKTILVTSPSVREGKTTSASFLAISIASWHAKNVVLLDCDLRRPSIHKFFDLNRDKGLTEILLGKNSYRDCIKSSSLENLSIITSGTEVDFPTRLLESPNFKTLLAEIESYYDIIIADCAPVIPVNDALILGSLFDGAIIVLKAGHTQMEVAKRAVELLKEAEVNLLGAIVNNMDTVFPYYYDNKYYGYDYSPRKRK